jgi:predicted MFS family arabinose efflux permease
MTETSFNAGGTPAPTRASRWIALAAMSVAVYGSYYAFDYIAPLAPLLSHQLHFSDSQIGLVGINLLIGWSNDHWLASATNPAGYHASMWLFTGIALLAVFSAVWLRVVETGPRAHGLETITTQR